MLHNLTRSDWPLMPGIHFLNHGSFGATPFCLLQEQHEWQLQLEAQPVLFHRELPALMHHARTAIAKFLSCGVNDVVFVENSTFGTNVAFNALATWLSAGDEIVVTSHEYGACIRAAKNRLDRLGVRIVEAHIPMPVPEMADVAQRIIDAFTPRTKAVFMSHITSPTGVQLPVETVIAEARKRDIVSVIDGSHVPGHIALNLRELQADIYTANFHKWMCTPKGSAFLYVGPEMQDRIPPLVTSWGTDGTGLKESTFVDEHEYLGTRDPSAFLTLPAALQWMGESNWLGMQAFSQNLARQAIDRVVDAELGTPITIGSRTQELQMGAAILPAGTNTIALKARLYERYNVEVVVHSWRNVPILRVSAHGHTSSNDVDALIEALKNERVRT